LIFSLILHGRLSVWMAGHLCSKYGRGITAQLAQQVIRAKASSAACN